MNYSFSTLTWRTQGCVRHTGTHIFGHLGHFDAFISGKKFSIIHISVFSDSPAT